MGLLVLGVGVMRSCESSSHLASRIVIASLLAGRPLPSVRPSVRPLARTKHEPSKKMHVYSMDKVLKLKAERNPAMQSSIFIFHDQKLQSSL
jgi:hypothetical protein